MTRIAIADDRTLIREGLKRIFEVEADFTIVIDAKDGYDLLEQLAGTECDVVAMDVSMPSPASSTHSGKCSTGVAPSLPTSGETV